MTTNNIPTKIIIDPRFNFSDSSYYLLGIKKLFNNKDISYDVSHFKDIAYRKDVVNYNGVLFIVQKGGKEHKVFVDPDDSINIIEDKYEWCDFYFKVNVTNEILKKYNKVRVIGPYFSILLGSKLKVLFMCTYMLLKGMRESHISAKYVLRDYLYCLTRRIPLGIYEKENSSKSGYVFHASTLWYNQFAVTDTNRYRYEFLNACKTTGIEVEGGLFYVNHKDVIAEMPDYPKYKETYRDFLCTKRFSPKDYVSKTKQSFVVFNTPSVCQCHGWKLGEFLCMGKAIISTPLSRILPGEGLKHGENVHFVNTPEEIRDAILLLKSNKAYRQKLEKGSRTYYDKYLAPEVVVKYIIDTVCE